MKEKKNAFKVWLQRKDKFSRSQYKGPRRTAKVAVKVAKELTWKEFGKRLESELIFKYKDLQIGHEMPYSSSYSSAYFVISSC